jgi:hypothetical protein
LVDISQALLKLAGASAILFFVSRSDAFIAPLLPGRPQESAYFSPSVPPTGEATRLRLEAVGLRACRGTMPKDD